MNLRVLVYMNPVVVDKISKSFLYEKDSGFLFMRGLIDTLPTDWHFYILVPKGVNRQFFSKKHFIEYIEYDYSTSVHQNRYHFNRTILADNFPYGVDVDVIINNQPEVSANLNVFFQNQRREKPIILNFFHWLDCKESSAYAEKLSGFIYRQLDGVLSADMSFFHTEYAKRLFDDTVKEITSSYSNYQYGFFQPQPTQFGHDHVSLPNKKIILFNHRLNNSTGWQEIVDNCKALSKDRKDFVLWLTDDQNIKIKRELEKYDFIINKKARFSEYAYLIKNSHFSVCNTKKYATWNMALLDSLVNGCLGICPDNDLYRTMFGESGVYFTNIKDAMNKYLDNTIDQNREILSNIQLPFTDLNLEKIIIDEIKKRLPTTKPVKYDDVVNYIKERKDCTKTDFINKFWSFHANSNFQIIRWFLLLGGFYDDMRKHNTTYQIDKIQGKPIEVQPLECFTFE